MIGACPHCESSWHQSEGKAHCATCCRTFSTERNFRAHRTGAPEWSCVDPATLLDKQGRPRFKTRAEATGCVVWVGVAGDYDPSARTGLPRWSAIGIQQGESR